jgi:hypothetical protein
VLPAERLDQLLVHDLDDLLAGSDGLHDLLAHRASSDPGKQVVRDLHRDVGVDQGVADVREAGIHLLRMQLPSRPELLENAVEAVGELLEHGASVYGSIERGYASTRDAA